MSQSKQFVEQRRAAGARATVALRFGALTALALSLAPATVTAKPAGSGLGSAVTAGAMSPVAQAEPQAVPVEPALPPPPPTSNGSEPVPAPRESALRPPNMTEIAEPPPPPPPLPSKLPRFQLGIDVGYVFDAGVDGPNGEVQIDGSAKYLGYLGFLFRPGLWGILSYSLMPSELVLDPFGLPEQRLMGFDVHYFHLGIQQEFLPGPVRPYLEFLLGATLFHPRAAGYEDEVRFSTILGGGAKFLLHQHFGLRAEARLLSSFGGGGSAVFCGVGGCAYGLFGEGILQFELGGGAFVNF